MNKRPIFSSFVGCALIASHVAFAQNAQPSPDNKPAPAENKPAAADAKAPEGKPAESTPPAEPKPIVETVEIEGGYSFTVQTTEAPDLTEWAKNELIPVVKKWYPEIVKMLPSEGYEAPKKFSVNFTDSYKGVAATMGNRIVCYPPWYRKELKREAIGSVVHELVHVVQQYRGRRGGTRPPGWLVEGIPDFIRWYLYEPESKGAEIRPNRAANAKYDGSYRVSANFLNFVIGKYDKDLIKDLNAVLREGKYDVEIWKKRTGKTVEELAEEWKKGLIPTDPAKPAEPAKTPEPAKPAEAPKPAEPAK